MLVPSVRGCSDDRLRDQKMKHTEYFMQSRGLPLLSREKANPLGIAQDMSVSTFASLGTAGRSLRSWRLEIRGHVIFKELKLRLRTAWLHYLPIGVGHSVPLSRETFIPTSALRWPQKSSWRDVLETTMQLCCVRTSLSVHAFRCILISRMCSRIPWWGNQRGCPGSAFPGVPAVT